MTNGWTLTRGLTQYVGTRAILLHCSSLVLVSSGQDPANITAVSRRMGVANITDTSDFGE
jgi:hypothetical protein